MKIDPDLKTSACCPSDCLIEVLRRPLNVRISLVLLECPVAYRYSHQIKSSTSNFLNVGFCDPGGPVALQNGRGVRIALTQCVLVDSTTCRLKYRWRDPWLKYEPSTKIDTFD